MILAAWLVSLTHSDVMLPDPEGADGDPGKAQKHVCFSPASVIKTAPLCKLSCPQHITTRLVFCRIQIVSLPCTGDVVKQRESNS